MDGNLSIILEECLNRLQKGQNLEDCLKLYPREADKLRPLLLAALKFNTVTKAEPRLDAVIAGREKMLASARRILHPQHAEQKMVRLSLRLAFCFIGILLASMIFVVTASAHSLPGNPLYGIKRGLETIRLELTVNISAKQSLEAQFAHERLKEINSMTRNGISGILTIEGVLEAVEDKTWTVSGLQMGIDPHAIIEGIVAIDNRLSLQVMVGTDGQITMLSAHFYDQIAQPISTPRPISTMEQTITEGSDETEIPVLPSATATLEPKQAVEPTSEEQSDDEEEPEDELENADNPTEEVEENIELTEEHKPPDEESPTEQPELTEEP